jgi:transposase-like protein
MARKRRSYSATLKARVALEALRERKTVAEIASQHQVAPTNITKWKQVALERLPELFKLPQTSDDKLVESLYEQIGRLQVELAWMKKNERLFIG